MIIGSRVLRKHVENHMLVEQPQNIGYCMLGCWHMLAKASHHWVVLTFADICGQSILSACGSSRSREPREKVLLLVYRWWSIPNRYLFRDVYTIYICDMMYMYIYIYMRYIKHIFIYTWLFLDSCPLSHAILPSQVPHGRLEGWLGDMAVATLGYIVTVQGVDVIIFSNIYTWDSM